MAFGAPFPGPGNVTLSFNGVQTAVPANTPTSFTFSFGVASSSRIIVAALSYFAVGGVGSVTIDGLSATKVATSNNGSNFAELWAVADSGASTSGTITVGSGTGSNPRLAVASYSLYGAASATPLQTSTSFSVTFSSQVTAVLAAANNTNFGSTTYTALTRDAVGTQSNGGNTINYSMASGQLLAVPITATANPPQDSIVFAGW